MKRLSLLTLATTAFALLGCDSANQREIEVMPAASSSEALGRALEALEQRDSDDLLSLVDGDAQAREFFRVVVETFETTDAFEAKFTEAYGESAWAAFIDPAGSDEHGAGMSLSLPDFGELKKEAASWVANDENDGVYSALPGVTLPFTESAGGWVIDGANLFPDEETLAALVETQKLLIEFIRSYMKAIGHDGISAEDIDYQMGKDLLIKLMGGELQSDGGSANPDRFRIEDL